MQVEVLVFEGCPHAGAAIALVREVAARLAPGASVDRVEIDTPEKAATLGFLGSPSVRVNGEDLERRSTSRGALCCRTYSGEGVPPEWMVEAAILRALKPGGHPVSLRGQLGAQPDGGRDRAFSCACPYPDMVCRFPPDACPSRGDCRPAARSASTFRDTGPRQSPRSRGSGSIRSSRCATRRSARFLPGMRGAFTGAFPIRAPSRDRKRSAFARSGARAMNCAAASGLSLPTASMQVIRHSLALRRNCKYHMSFKNSFLTDSWATNL